MAGAAQTIGWLLTIDDSDFVTKIEAIKTHVQEIKDDVEDADTTILGGIADRLSSLGTAAQTLVNTGIDAAIGGVGFIKNIVGGAVTGITAMVVAGATTAWSAITGGLKIIWDLVMSILGPVLQMLKGAFFDALKAIMDPIMMVFRMAIAPFVYFMMPVIQRWLIQVLLWALKGVKVVLGYLKDKVPTIVGFFQKAYGIAKGVLSIVGGIGKSVIGGAKEAFKGLKGEENAWSTGFNKTLDALGIDSEKFWDDLYKAGEKTWDFFTDENGGFRKAMKATWDVIGPAAKKAWDGIKKTGEAVMKGLRGESNMLSEGWNDAMDAMGVSSDDFWAGVLEYIDATIEGFKNLGKAVATFFTEQNMLSEQFASQHPEGKDFWGYFWKGVGEDVGLLAEGGIVTKPTLSWVGEGGQAEAVVPLPKTGTNLSRGEAEKWAEIMSGMMSQLASPVRASDSERGEEQSTGSRATGRLVMSGGAQFANGDSMEKLLEVLTEIRDSLESIQEETEYASWSTDPDFNGQLFRNNFER